MIDDNSVRQERNFADVVLQGKMRKARIFLEDYVIRKVDKIANIGNYITVCLPGAKVEDVAEKAGQDMGGAAGGAVLVHVGMSHESRIGQIVLSRMLPVMGGRGEVYRNCRRMAINIKVQKV